MKAPTHDSTQVPTPGDPAALSAPGYTLQDIRALSQVMQDFGLTDLELTLGSGQTLRLARGAMPAAPASLPVAPAAAPVISLPMAHLQQPVHPAAPSPQATKSAVPANQIAITAPLVGTFYRSPSPESPMFVQVGQRVRKGQVLCIIEAMKLMNELESEVDGVVTAILAENGRPVEFGEPLFHVQRDA